MKSRKKLIVLGLALLVLVFVIVCLVRRPSGIADADLQVVRRSIPNEQNGYFLLDQAWTRFGAAQNGYAQFTLPPNTPTNWDAEQIAAMLDEHQEELELFAQSRRLPSLQVPEPLNVEEDHSYLGYWKNLAQLQALRAKQLFHNGQEKEAFNLAIDIVRFGDQIEASDGVILHYLVGAATKRIGFNTLREFARTTLLNRTVLLDYAKQTSSLGANRTALTNVIKGEYRLQTTAVKQILAGSFPGSTNSSRFEKRAVSVLSRPFLDLDRTQTGFAEFARAQLAGVPKPWIAMSTNRVPRLTNTTDILFSGNPIGEVYKSMLLPATERFLIRKCREDVDAKATTLMVLLRCYQMDHGTLPNSLTNLIPEFMAEVPTDDFDGKPLRYFPAKKILYSVGEDLIDSDGVEKDAKNAPLDIPFAVDFAPAK